MFINGQWIPIFFSPDGGDGGGAGGTDGKPDDKKPEKKNGDGAGEKKEYTQAELDTMFAERARSASSAATKALLDKFNVKTVEELDGTLKKAKELEDAQLSEADKSKKEAESARKLADEAKTAGEAAIARANDRLMQAEIKAQAGANKFRKEALDDVWLLVKSDPKLLDKLKVDDNGTVTGGEAVVKEIAKSRAHWLDTGNGSKGTPRTGEKKPDDKSGDQQPRGHSRKTSTL